MNDGDTLRTDTPATFLDRNAAIDSVDFLLADSAGVLRAKRVRRADVAGVWQSGMRLPGSVFSMDTTGRIVDGTGIVAEDGEQDRFCLPVAGTLAPVPWSAGADGRPRRAQVLTMMHEADGAPFFADPRAVLARVASRFADLGLTPVVATELEFYLVDPESRPVRPIAVPGGDLTHVYAVDRIDAAAPFIDDLVACCDALGLRAGAAVAESGPGHLEVNLHHVADPLRAADEGVLFKRAVRALATRHGAAATFMAKPFAERGGSGLHIHVSLCDREGRNVFESPAWGPYADPLRHALGGLAATMGEAMAVFAPNANSYRRYKVGAFVPVSPSWGYNNRTTALRLPPPGGGAMRIEHRVAGADANIHLTLAAILAGIHHGLTTRAEPPAETAGDGYAANAPSLPLSWRDALAAFAAGRVLPGYFGEAYCSLHQALRRAELQRFESVVTPLEHEWYLGTV